MGVPCVPWPTGEGCACVGTKIMITTSCLRLRSGGSPIRAGPPKTHYEQPEVVVAGIGTETLCIIVIIVRLGGNLTFSLKKT